MISLFLAFLEKLFVNKDFRFSCSKRRSFLVRALSCFSFFCNMCKLFTLDFGIWDLTWLITLSNEFIEFGVDFLSSLEVTFGGWGLSEVQLGRPLCSVKSRLDFSRLAALTASIKAPEPCGVVDCFFFDLLPFFFADNELLHGGRFFDLCVWKSSSGTFSLKCCNDDSGLLSVEAQLASASAMLLAWRFSSSRFDDVTGSDSEVGPNNADDGLPSSSRGWGSIWGGGEGGEWGEWDNGCSSWEGCLCFKSWQYKLYSWYGNGTSILVSWGIVLLLSSELPRFILLVETF